MGSVAISLNNTNNEVLSGDRKSGKKADGTKYQAPFPLNEGLKNGLRTWNDRSVKVGERLNAEKWKIKMRISPQSSQEHLKKKKNSRCSKARETYHQRGNRDVLL